MDSIVKDLSFVGKTSSKISFIISCIISVVLLYLSYVFFTKTDDFITINSDNSGNCCCCNCDCDCHKG
jgi:hypothetical protein